MKHAVVFVLILGIFASCQSETDKKAQTGTLPPQGNFPTYSRAEFTEEMSELESRHNELNQIGIVFLHERDPNTGKSLKTRCDTGLYTAQFLEIKGDVSEGAVVSIDDLVRGLTKKISIVEEHAKILNAFNEIVMLIADKYGRGPFVILELDGSKKMEALTIGGMAVYEVEREQAVNVADALKEVALACKDRAEMDSIESELPLDDSCKIKVSGLLSRLNADKIQK